MPKIIDVHEVNKIYESAGGLMHALKNVSLSVGRNEFLCIMGPSGSGKSTLMNILGCLDRASSGLYRLDGLDVSLLRDGDLAEVRSKKIGFVFQSFNLLPKMSVMENVTLPLIYSDLPKRKRLERGFGALMRVGLDPQYYDNRANELSGGQMQRVAIARAIVNDPVLLLADEPTGNLDTATGEQVLQTFSRLCDLGKTIVLITHDPTVCEWGDRTVHIRDGRVYTDEEERARRTEEEARGRGERPPYARRRRRREGDGERRPDEGGRRIAEEGGLQRVPEADDRYREAKEDARLREAGEDGPQAPEDDYWWMPGDDDDRGRHAGGDGR